MKQHKLEQLTEQELRTAFRRHTFRGLAISLVLMVLFFVLYLTPVEIEQDLLGTLMIGIAAVSVSLAIWYHLGRRRFYKEFRRRRIQIR